MGGETVERDAAADGTSQQKDRKRGRKASAEVEDVGTKQLSTKEEAENGRASAMKEAAPNSTAGDGVVYSEGSGGEEKGAKGRGSDAVGADAEPNITSGTLSSSSGAEPSSAGGGKEEEAVEREQDGRSGAQKEREEDKWEEDDGEEETSETEHGIWV